ncbi:TPA: ABC transporter permease, partial [Escherichia coli]|nr:ABC transporter permease [Escherichia coli]
PFYTGTSPFSNDIKMVLGTDKIKLSNRGIEIPSLFENNAILIAEEAGHWNDKIIFLNGIPFKIAGEIKNKKTEFLDSLGLSSFRDNINYIIPIETMFRLTL